MSYGTGETETAAVQGDDKFWEETCSVADLLPHFSFFVWM